MLQENRCTNACFKLRCFLPYFLHKSYTTEGKSLAVASCSSEDGAKVTNHVNMSMVMRCHASKYMIKNENQFENIVLYCAILETMGSIVILMLRLVSQRGRSIENLKIAIDTPNLRALIKVVLIVKAKPCFIYLLTGLSLKEKIVTTAGAYFTFRV